MDSVLVILNQPPAGAIIDAASTAAELDSWTQRCPTAAPATQDRRTPTRTAPTTFCRPSQGEDSAAPLSFGALFTTSSPSPFIHQQDRIPQELEGEVCGSLLNADPEVTSSADRQATPPPAVSCQEVGVLTSIYWISIDALEAEGHAPDRTISSHIDQRTALDGGFVTVDPSCRRRSNGPRPRHHRSDPSDLGRC